MTISHKNLAGTQLHETKGVASATDYHVHYALSGVGTWAKLTSDNLTYGQLLHVQDQQANNVGGGNASANSWQKRPCNTIVTNEIGATVTTSVFTIPAGTYEIDAYSAAYQSATNYCKIRWRNTTAGTTLVQNIGQYLQSQSMLYIGGRFTLAISSTCELQYLFGAASTDGLGLPFKSGLSSMTELEIHADVKIWRIK